MPNLLMRTVLCVMALLFMTSPSWACKQSAAPQTFLLQPAGNGQALTTSWATIEGVSLTYTVDQTSLVTVMGHIGLENMCTTDNDSNGMVATQLVNENGITISGSFHTTNLDRPRHYEDMIILAQYTVEAGQHQLAAQTYKKNFPPPSDNVDYIVKTPAGYSGVFVKIEALPTTSSRKPVARPKMSQP